MILEFSFDFSVWLGCWASLPLLGHDQFDHVERGFAVFPFEGTVQREATDAVVVDFIDLEVVFWDVVKSQYGDDHARFEALRIN